MWQFFPRSKKNFSEKPATFFFLLAAGEIFDGKNVPMSGLLSRRLLVISHRKQSTYCLICGRTRTATVRRLIAYQRGVLAHWTQEEGAVGLVRAASGQRAAGRRLLKCRGMTNTQQAHPHFSRSSRCQLIRWCLTSFYPITSPIPINFFIRYKKPLKNTKNGNGG